MESTTINIADITIDPAFQMRAAVSPDTVDDYADTITSTEAEWPFSTPCSVYRVSGQMILTDGFHRLAAMQKAGRDAIRATVTDGSKSDALIAALGANHSHGLRRTNADKRRAVTMALADDLLSSMSDRELSTLCGVSHPFVGQIRSELETVTTSEVMTRIGADRKIYPTTAAAAENRKKIETAITSQPTASNVKIAESVGVSDKTVASVRAEISRPKQVTPEPEPEPEVAVNPKSPFDTFVELWESASVDARPELRKQIAEFLSLAEPQSSVKPGELFQDAAEEKRSVGRKKPTEAEFEAFWQAYPRRTEKGNARKAFEKAFTNLREQYSISEAIEKIMSGVDTYAENADPDYLCHPATWLNGCRWDDEPASIGKVKKKSHSDFGKYDEATADEPW